MCLDFFAIFCDFLRFLLHTVLLWAGMLWWDRGGVVAQSIGSDMTTLRHEITNRHGLDIALMALIAFGSIYSTDSTKQHRDVSELAYVCSAFVALWLNSRLCPIPRLSLSLSLCLSLSLSIF